MSEHDSAPPPPPSPLKQISDQERQRIGNRLGERTSGICPMCGFNQWMVVEGYSSIDVQKSPRELVIGGPHIPTATAVCKRCGFIAMHALKVLGLFDPQG